MTVSEFDRVPGIFEPGQETVVRENPALPHRVTIDSLGYRGADFPRERPSGEFRILYVGDSFVFGTFVDDDETLPARLELELELRCRVRIQVVNAGLGGSTITEQARMIERGMAIDPDLVILQFSENDVRDLKGLDTWDRLRANREAKSSFPLSLVYPWARDMALWNLSLRALANVRDSRAHEGSRDDEGQRRQAEEEWGGARSATAVEEGRHEYRKRLRTLKEGLEGRGIPLVLTVFPSHLSVYDRWESDQLQWLDDIVEAMGIRTVRFLPAFVADGRGETELYLLPRDGHPSPEGYQVAARHLAESLISFRVLPAHCGRDARSISR